MTPAYKVEKPTRDQVVEVVEDGAQHRFGISASELVARIRAGTFEDPYAAGDLMILLDLLAVDDPIFNGRV